MSVSTELLNEMNFRRRTLHLWCLGPISISVLLAKIEAELERPAPIVVDLRHRRCLHLAPAVRPTRAA
jgi:hypothetical protein